MVKIFLPEWAILYFVLFLTVLSGKFLKHAEPSSYEEASHSERLDLWHIHRIQLT